MKLSDFKVGDKVKVVDNRLGAPMGVDNVGYITEFYEELELLKPASSEVASTGGPSSYYDQPYRDWITVNDQMEWLAKNKWGDHAIHLKDIFKGLCRWNTKKGTTPAYDTRKIVYYGLRVLRMIEGPSGVQSYLKELKENPQFKEKIHE